MVFVWEDKMRVTLCVLLSAICVLANKNGNRRTKPFIADAVGNTLPPPSNVPATVGSPISLLTPDRYEFYTFDESGELVKKLMTLEEIQAIVAAGEDSDGLVTFANDNQPTIAFNFSQPPYTKVHSVVTNVQNVLKAQMEAHKNKPLVQPTLDTPDVSDSWSLILPSIFGNSGVDIQPDKTASSFTPETETLEESLNTDDEENSLSKEGSNPIDGSTTVPEYNNVPVTEQSPVETIKISVSTSTSTTTTTKPTTTRKNITTKRPLSTSTTTQKPVTTSRPRSTTTKAPAPSTTRASPTSTTKVVPSTTTTSKPTTTTTTSKPTTTKSVPKTTTLKPAITTKKQVATTSTTIEYISNDIPTANPIPEFEKISTFIPISTVNYVTERTTRKPAEVTKSPIIYASTTKRSPQTSTKLPQPNSSTLSSEVHTTTALTSSINNVVYISSTAKFPDQERINVTTITTQSVSPSTADTSTELSSLENSQNHLADNAMKHDDPIIPLFDVAQSISQIASDLENNYEHIPTTSNLLDKTKENTIDNMESKENVDLDIPNQDNSNIKDKTEDNFVKISTIDPHPQSNETDSEKENKIQNDVPIKVATEFTTTENVEVTTLGPASSEGSTIDPILTESMEDLLSQVSNEVPLSIVDSQTMDTENNNEIITTEKNIETTTDLASEIMSTTSEFITKEITSTSQKTYSELESETSTKITTESSTTTKKVISKISASDQNKVDKEGTLRDKDDKNKDFVQISISAIPTSAKVEFINEKDKPVSEVESSTSSNKNTIPAKSKNEIHNDTVDTEIKVKESTLDTSTIFTKMEVTTILSILSTAPPKAVFDNQSSIKINHKKDKLPEPLPKVDEFKKKIQKVNDEELVGDRNDSWKLIPTVIPPKENDISNNGVKPSAGSSTGNNNDNKDVVLAFSQENQGLEVTTKDLGVDIAQFVELCNELSFRYWNVMVENIDNKRSFVLSPYSITSMLAMMFMGAKGATSGEMNEILKLDDMVTFNPHFTLKNISDSIDTATNSGIAVSAFVRELFSDRNKGKILTFYKERAQHFYSGHVEEINFKLISDIIRRRTNLLVKKHTWGKIPEFMKTNNIVLKPPLAAFSTNIFETDCTGTSVDGRDGEMYFVVSPNVRQRRLVPVPSVVYKAGFLAGYDPALDATAAALGNTNSIVSTMFLMPGQQGNIVHADDLEKLEQRLIDADQTTQVWSRLLRTLLPRPGLELQIPRFSHSSVFNVSSALKEMGLKDVFDADHADLGGLNGPSKDLYLSDMIQMTSFTTCGEGLIGEQHHIEEYPTTLGIARRRASRWADWDEPRDYQRAFHDPHDGGEAMHMPLHLRPRQARVPTRSVQPARLKFDRPFLFFVRHNPSGMILYVGRYNPRLLP